MRSENVLFFPFKSYFTLKRLQLKDKKDEYLYDVFRECFFAHRPLTAKMEYIEGAHELHYVNILVGTEMVEMVTFVSQTFREVFAEVDGHDWSTEVITMEAWYAQPFTRAFVEVPSPVIFLDQVRRYLEDFRDHVFPDWEEGFSLLDSAPPQLPSLEEASEPSFIYLEKVRVKEYTKEMLREVLENTLYDLIELNSGEFVFITTREGRRQWERMFPPQKKG